MLPQLMTPAEGESTPTIKDFKRVLEESPKKAAAFLEAVHPADVAGWLHDVQEEDAWQVFSALETELQAEVLEFAEDSFRSDLVQRLSAGDLREVVEELPPDEAVDVLADADDRVVADVLEAIPIELADDLRGLIAYPPESAGGLMTSEFVTVRQGERLGDAIKQIKQEGEQAEEEIGVFVVDENSKPIGFLSDRALLTNPIHSSVEEVMAEPITVLATEDQEEAANLIHKYGLIALAVVDGSGALVGVISSEDAHDVLKSEASEDILRMVGTAPILQTRLPIMTRVRQRMPLMAVTALGGLLSAKILAWFMGGEGDDAMILRYLPLIIGLAGNVGIQSATILVRGFATGEVEQDREPAVFASEVTVGTLIGIICGGMTALFASWMESGTLYDPLGGAVGSAVAVAVCWAAILGCMVPMGCRRLGIDPAIVAGPFLICLSDISGSAIYIVVASRLLPLVQ